MGGIDVWTEPVWLARATAWIDRELDRLGRPRTGPVEQPHVRHWSTAMRIPTGDGPVWFKATVPVLAHEAGVIRVLSEALPEAVSILLASEPETGWMLLEDAGDRLRELIDHDPDETVRRWEAVLPLYAELQQAAAPRLPELFAAGTPDFRLAGIPRLYEGLLADEAPLRAGEEPLGDDDLRALHALAPRVAEICAELAAFGYPESIQHDDLHDGQLFVRDGRYAILDWGDACVSHPFATLTVALNSIAYSLGADRTTPEVVRARDAYLDAWPGERADKLRAFELADLLGHLSRARTYQLLVGGLPPAGAAELQDSVPGWLGAFLEAAAQPT